MTKTCTVVARESGIGLYGQVLVAGQHAWTADLPESLGGQATGPDPYELLASALAVCTAQTIRMYVTRKGWPLTRVSVTVTYTQAAPADRFDCAIALEGALDEEQRRRILEVAGRCPVNQTLSRASEISKRLA